MTISVIFGWVLQASVAGAVLAAALLLLKLILKDRLDARWHYYIWLLLVARLLLPFAPESRLSIFNAVPVQEMVASANLAPAAAQTPLPGGAPGEAPQSALPGGEAATGTGPAAAAGGEVETSSPAAAAGGWIFYIIWLAGAAALGFYMLFINVRQWRQYRRGALLADPSLAELVAQCRQELGIRADPPLVSCPGIATPALFGFLRPRLLLPEGLSRRLTRDELRCVVMHELAHLKRVDILLYWLTGILQVLHWFNPLVWYSFYRMRQDAEVACDAFVLSRLRPAERKKYGETMLKLAEAGPAARPMLLPGLAGIVEEESQLKRRITAIARFRKSPLALTVAGLAICLLLGAIFLTSASLKSAISIGRPALIKVYYYSNHCADVEPGGAHYDQIIAEMEKMLQKKNLRTLFRPDEAFPDSDLLNPVNLYGLELYYHPELVKISFTGLKFAQRLYLDLSGSYSKLFGAAGPGSPYSGGAYVLGPGAGLPEITERLFREQWGLPGEINPAEVEEIIVAHGQAIPGERFRLREGSDREQIIASLNSLQFCPPQPRAETPQVVITVIFKDGEPLEIQDPGSGGPFKLNYSFYRADSGILINSTVYAYSDTLAAVCRAYGEIFAAMRREEEATWSSGPLAVRPGGRYTLYPGPAPWYTVSPGEIAGGTVVEILEGRGLWARVISNETEGWIPRWFLSDDEEAKPVRPLSSGFKLLNQSADGRLYPGGPAVVELEKGRLLKPLQEWDGWLEIKIIAYSVPAVHTAWLPAELLSETGEVEPIEGFLKKGTFVYEGSEFNRIGAAREKAIDADLSVFVHERREGFILVSGAGGWIAWTRAENLAFD